MSRISISIVTYNNRNEIIGVLNSIRHSDDLKEFEIFIVDNCSNDGTADFIEQEYPECKVLRMTKNLGYGSGHNQAIRIVESDYHVIINPDIQFAPGTIKQFEEYLDANPNVVLISPRVINTDGSVQNLPRKKPTIKFLLGGLLESKGQMFKNWRDEFTLANENIVEPIEIDFCTGCFMFCRTSALQNCNGFDERYFMYGEDADLTRELQKIGKTMYVPQIEVIHEWKRENRSLKGRLRQVTSMTKYFFKWGLK